MTKTQEVEVWSAQDEVGGGGEPSYLRCDEYDERRAAETETESRGACWLLPKAQLDNCHNPAYLEEVRSVKADVDVGPRTAAIESGKADDLAAVESSLPYVQPSKSREVGQSQKVCQRVCGMVREGCVRGRGLARRVDDGTDRKMRVFGQRSSQVVGGLNKKESSVFHVPRQGFR
jgi:hypothetical protein